MTLTFHLPLALLTGCGQKNAGPAPAGPAHARDYFWQANGGATPATGYPADFTLTRAQLLGFGISFASGTPVYAVAYGTGPWSSGRTGPATGIQLVWPTNCNPVPSPVVRFAMP